MFIVDNPSPGLSFDPIRMWLNPTKAQQHMVHLDNVRVPQTKVLGEVGMGFSLGQKWLVHHDRLLRGSMALGILSRALEMAIEWAKQRVTYGRPIADRQAIQWMLTDVYIDIMTLRAATREAAARADNDEDVRVEASMIKYCAGEWGCRSIDKIMQVFGGMGETLDLPIGPLVSPVAARPDRRRHLRRFTNSSWPGRCWTAGCRSKARVSFEEWGKMPFTLSGKRVFLVVIGAILAVLLAATYGPPAFAEGEGNSPAGIWVTGHGSASGSPDLAILSLGVEVLAESAADARTEAAEGIDAAIEALEDNDVAEEDIQTRHYSIGPRYNYVEVTQCVDEEGEAVVPGETGDVPAGTQCTRAHNQVLDGYQVTNRLAVTVRDLDSVGAIIDAVIEAAGDSVRINGINFSIEDSAALEDEAREAAVADLLAKAARLAELAGVELGSLLFLSESTSPTPYPPVRVRL